MLGFIDFLIFVPIYGVRFILAVFTWLFFHLSIIDLWLLVFLTLIIWYWVIWKYLPTTFLAKWWFYSVKIFNFFFGPVLGQYAALFVLAVIWLYVFYRFIEPALLYLFTPEMGEITNRQQLQLIKEYLTIHTDTDAFGLRLRGHLLRVIKKKGVIKDDDFLILRSFVCWVEGATNPRALHPADLSSWV